MKRFLLLVCVVMGLASPAWGGGLLIGSGISTQIEDCTPNGSILSESFGDGSTACFSGATGDDATCDNTWGISGDSVSFHHALTGLPTTGSCVYGILSDTSNENAEKILFNYGSSIAYTTTTDIKFSIYFNNMTVDTNANIWIVMASEGTTATNMPAVIVVRNNSGTYVLSVYSSTSSFVGNVPININTWYDVVLRLDATASDSYFQVVGGGSTTCDQTTDCKFTRDNKNKQYFQIGSLSNEGASESISFEMGYFYVN